MIDYMISVVLATYNEEKNIEQCLKSVTGFADEIVVVDGNSTDKTASLANNLGAKVITTTNKTNFHINKQMAIDAAQGEVILQLDADEVADAQLKEFIEKLHYDRVVGKAVPLDSQPVAWWVRRKNFFMGGFLKKGGQYPDPVIRLFIKGKARLPQRDVHEQMRVKGEVGWAQGHLIHYSNPTFSDYWRKFKTYTSFQAHQLKRRNFRINIFSLVNYLLIKPVITFFKLFIRHLGILDGLRGLVFAFMSALHHPVVIIKLINLKLTTNQK